MPTRYQETAGRGLVLAAFMILTAAARAASVAAGETPDLSASDLAGTWVATATHAGESRALALEFAASENGEIVVKLSSPAIHVWGVPVAKATVEGRQVKVGSFITLDYDRAAGTLSGVVPAALVPVYELPVVFRRAALERAARPELTARAAKPAWTFEAGAPLWADVAYGGGVVYAGADDGRLHALAARTGKVRWSFRAGGAIRARPTLAGGDVYVKADDGFLYRLDAARGVERWKVRVEEKPIERIPINDPRSRFDRWASSATLAQGRLYIGTHDGRVQALDPRRGARLWEFATGDSVIATPVVDSGRVYFGSFDGSVYALDAGTGALVWKHPTGAPVVSSPAVHEGHVIVGSRSYDLLALDGPTGAPIWTRYVWFSWVESPVTIRGGTGYVGSSDAARLFAFDARTGRSAWEIDVHGWAWGQPAVTEARVFVATFADPNYVVKHQAGLLAVDRETGTPVWRYPLEEPADGRTYGFPAAPAVGEGLVFVGGVDGRVYAFAQ
jgi:outer membrane protein assembly factor BamB